MGALAINTVTHESAEDVKIKRLLEGALCKESKDPSVATMKFPQKHLQALSEYSLEKIFLGAFPWLFPGGVGDYGGCRQHEVTVDEWANHFLRFPDGRFQKDKLWCFYALNYCQRRRNQVSGGYFVTSDFLGSAPKSLEELKTDIANGNNKWIDHLTYWNCRCEVPMLIGELRGQKSTRGSITTSSGATVHLICS